jgi:hypothetical protein
VTETASLPLVDRGAVYAFVALLGTGVWTSRTAEIAAQAAAGSRTGAALWERQAIHLAIEQLRRSGSPISTIGHHIVGLTAQAVALSRQLSPAGRVRFDTELHSAMQGDATLVPLFHLLRTAALHRARGFTVRFAGLEDGAPFDLLLSRGDTEAEVACEVVSAEDGRPLHRGAWLRLADRLDPDLQTWLATHPGRFLLKMTLPNGLRAAEDDALADLHQRIRAMLEAGRRLDHSKSVVLRLDPLLLVAARSNELGLVSQLRRDFGPEAHLSVTSVGQAVFVMAGRAGCENEIAAAIRRCMASVAATRLTGTRPGILAMFIDDIDRSEWCALRELPDLESEARRFLLQPLAARVVAITCASRMDMFGMLELDAGPRRELRFRNPAHPAAGVAALAPAVLSSVRSHPTG